MANEILTKSGTAKVFAAAGGNAAITLASLADTKAQQSVKLDLGATRGPTYDVFVEIETGGAAPAAGECVYFYWSESPSVTAGTQNAGGASGADAAYNDGSEAEWLKQLEFLGALVLTADASTVQRQRVGTFSPGLRYGSLVVWNESGQTFETNNDEHKVTLTPIIPEVQ